MLLVNILIKILHSVSVARPELFSANAKRVLAYSAGVCETFFSLLMC